MGVPTRFPFGVNNAKSSQNMGDFGMLDPTKYHVYFNDFDTYVAGDWTITTTEAGGGDATEALADEDGGVLLITNDAADDDADFFQKKGESFKFAAGKKLFFKARFKVSDATQSDFVMGLQITDTTPLAVTDGVYFLKSDGSAACTLKLTKNSTTTSSNTIATIVADTYVALGFYYNGVDKVLVYLNDVVIQTMTVLTNLVDDEELTISFGIQNGEAVAKTMSVDYIFAAKER